MTRVRWLIAPAVVLVLAACGDPEARNSEGSTASTIGAPQVIHLGASGANPVSASDTPIPVEADGGNGSDGQVEPMPIQPTIITYVAGGELPALGGSGPSFRLPAGTTPDPHTIERVATALGVEGEVTRQASDQGGGWVVGSADGPSLQVSSDGMLNWWYNPAAQAAPEPATDVPGESAGSAVPGGSPGTAISPGPPAGVPTKDEATARAGELLAAMGIDPAEVQLEAYADDWGASVTAWTVLDGRRSPLATSFGFGADGALTWAGGTLATPVRGADYPLIGTDAALQRLNDNTVGWLAISGGGSVATRSSASEPVPASIEPAPGPANRAPEPVPPSSSSEECPVPLPDVQLPNPGPDAPVSSDGSCVPPVMNPAPTKVTVTLTKVTDDLSSVWDQDGNVWILPAYTFRDDSGGTYTVLAVSDQYVDVANR